MPDVIVSIVANLLNANPPAALPLSFCPVEIYALRASVPVQAQQAPGGGPVVVQTQRVVVIRGRTTNERGELVLSDADRAAFQPGDQVFVQATLDDPGVVVVKRFAGAHATYVLHMRTQNPAAPRFLENLLFASRSSDTRMLPIVVEQDVNLAASSIADTARARDAANAFSVIGRINRWFASLGTATAPLGRMSVHLPAPMSTGTHYDETVPRVVLDRTGAVPSVMAHEFGHHIFKKSQPGYDAPGGDHEWFRHATNISDAEQRKLDFSEGYATFCALNFLNESTYRDVGTGWNWTEALDVETMLGVAVPAAGIANRWGDGPTAGYLYDLTDTDEPFFQSLASDASPELREAADRFSKPFREIHDHFIRWGASLGAGTARTADRFHRYLKETAYPGEARALDVLWTRNLPGAAIPGVPAPAANAP